MGFFRVGFFTALILMFAGCLFQVCSQDFSVEQYKKALWMTTRMYGGQRSDDETDRPNWLLIGHEDTVGFVEDNDDGYNLSGGWHDCGDHVKFGQTGFFSVYLLLKAYDLWPEGFDDHYSPDYEGYSSSGDFSWEGGEGIPNGIPDILDEVKYATDYFIKCARDDNTFYSQVGNGQYDHKNWVTSHAMADLEPEEGGSPRPFKKNPDGASMASFCGASLSLMARVYEKFDPEYAEKCLEHALHAYNYAGSHPGTDGTITGDFYSQNSYWEDDYACMCVELYKATGDEAYYNEALEYSATVMDNVNIYWQLDYENNGNIAQVALAQIGDTDNLTHLEENSVASYKKSVNNEGFASAYGADGNWGPLRYGMFQSAVVAMDQALNDNADPDPFIVDCVDYILGSNDNSQSFVVGYEEDGASAPVHPHHRNVFMDDGNVEDKNSLQIPEKNTQHGYMVGGTTSSGSFPDDISNYETNEGGIDYNCGLVASLGYMISRLAPVDTSAFTGVSEEGMPVSAVDQSSRVSITTKPGSQVVLNKKVSRLRVMDLSGRVIYDLSGIESLSLSDLPKGIYIMNILTENRDIINRRIKR